MATYRMTLGIEFEAIDNQHAEPVIDQIIDLVNSVAYVTDSKVKRPEANHDDHPA